MWEGRAGQGYETAELLWEAVGEEAKEDSKDTESHLEGVSYLAGGGLFGGRRVIEQSTD